jgi:hypothetical protein
MAEEVVAEKRVVPTEEVVVRKHAVAEERSVEEDLRRERLDRESSMLADRGTVRADERVDADRDLIPDAAERGGARAARGTKSAARRVADAADDVKDRIDGDPATRPGPDPTDRESRF